MLKRFLALAITAGSLLLTGCASQMKMAYSDAPGTPAAADKAVYLMTATVKNSYKTGYQPKMIVTHVERDGGSKKDDRLNFKPDVLGTINLTPEEAGTTYLIRLELDKGQYVLRGMSCMSQKILIVGNFFVPLHSPLTVAAPGVYYLGHVEANVRERVGNEFRAGAAIPLVDQAVAGGSGGTFDVDITDRWDSDEKLFTDRIPALNKVQVNKAILPAFDRKAAQAWWEAN